MINSHRVVGLDLSLTATGVATIIGGDLPVTAVFGSKGSDGAPLPQRYRRLTSLVDQIMYAVAPGFERPELAVIESPAFSRTTGQQHDRSGLWWLLVHRIWDLQIPLIEVKPNVRAKYGTGNGRANKNQVIIAATRRYPEVEFGDDNEADALLLAAMGRRLLGVPIEKSLPQDHLEAMKTLKLPEGLHRADQEEG